MKTIAFALLIVGISAFPQQAQNDIALHEQRLVTDAIASVIEDVSQNIKNLGLDPFYIQSEVGAYALPVPVLFSVDGVIEEFLFQGLSEIVINNLSYSILTSRLRLDISLPLIELTSDKTDVLVILFGEPYSASASGRLAIKEVNINADIRVSVGIISGISIRSIEILFKLGGINSQLNLSVAGYDLSARTNTFLGTTIPETLTTFESEINELLEIVLIDIINANL